MQYKQRMFTSAIEIEYREATMCKWFDSNLTEPTLKWFTDLPNTAIDSFASLTDCFVEQFASSIIQEKITDDLYEVIRKKGKSLWSYVESFNKEKIYTDIHNILPVFV